MGTSFNYDDTSHQVIFDRINGGAGSEALQQSSQAWQRLGDDIGVTGKSYAQRAIGTILATRQGVAADAAVAATSAMLPWMDDVAQIASTAAQRAQGQAEHWVTARNSVPPVPPTPKPAGFAGDPAGWAAEKMDWFPGITSDEEQAQLRRQDAAEQARQAMRGYQSSSNGTVDPAPAFTAPQALDSSVGALPLGDPRVDTAGPGASTTTGGGPPAALPAAHRAVTPQPAAQPPAGYRPAATVSQLAGGGSPGTGSATPPPGAAKPAPGQGTAPGALPLGGTASTGSAGVAAGRPRAVSARGGAAGTRGTGGAAPGAGFGPRPSTSFGPRPTPTVHPIEEISARGGTGSAGATRGGGYGETFGGGAAGASQQPEKDREHRSKYLIYTDSNAIVGDLPPTAPPVIGADH